MSPRLRSLITCCLLAITTLLLYGIRLDGPLAQAERALADQARPIASSGHDLEGRLLPLFVQVEPESWRQPVPVYAVALAMVSDPAADIAVRWPGVLLGAFDVALLYLIAKRVLRHEWLSIASGVLLLLSPAHYVFSRLAADAIYVVPFALVWLLLLLEFVERPRAWLVPAATASLGVGVYTQPAAPLTMSAYLVVTIVALWLADCQSSRVYFSGVAGFVLPVMCMAGWFVIHPDSYQDTMGRWAIHRAHLRSPIDGLRAMANLNTMSTRASLYWGMFNPAALFLSAEPGSGRAMMHGTAPLLLPMLVQLPLGLSRLLAKSTAPIATAVFLTMALAPIAASTLTEPHAIDRAMAVLPSAALLAAMGTLSLVESRWRGWRWVGFGLLALAPLQFGLIYRGL